AMTVFGCAELRVHKVTLERRACQTDHQIKGFRYYLSRPYVVVKKRVPVSTDEQLFVIDTSKIENSNGTQLPDDDTFKRLFGTLRRSAGSNPQIIPVTFSKVDDQSGKIVPVSAQELQTMRGIIVAAGGATTTEQPSPTPPTPSIFASSNNSNST